MSANQSVKGITCIGAWALGLLVRCEAHDSNVAHKRTVILVSPLHVYVEVSFPVVVARVQMRQPP